MIGVVAEFDHKKGHGSIICDGTRNLFVHSNEIVGGIPGFKGLAAGQKVEYEVGHDRKGPYAKNVRVIPN